MMADRARIGGQTWIVGVGCHVGARQRCGHQLEPHAIQRSLRGSELRHDVAALVAFLDHSLNAPHLALQAAESLDHVGTDFLGKLHDLEYTPRGMLLPE